MPALPRKFATRKRRFIDSYVQSLNATKAALDAGYAKSHAHNQGYELLQIPDVQAAIAAKLRESELSAPRVLREIGRLAFSDAGELFDENGKLKRLADLPEATRAVVSSVKVLKTNLVSGDGSREEVHEVKLWDKVKALEMAAKYLKLLDETRDTNVTLQVTWVNGMQPTPGAGLEVQAEPARLCAPIESEHRDTLSGEAQDRQAAALNTEDEPES